MLVGDLLLTGPSSRPSIGIEDFLEDPQVHIAGAEQSDDPLRRHLHHRLGMGLIGLRHVRHHSFLLAMSQCIRERQPNSQ